VTAIFKELKNEGVVIAPFLATLNEDFVIPEGIDLTLSSAGTTLLSSGAPAYSLTVNGILRVITSPAALTPLGDITIKGALHLATGTSLTVAATGNKILKIPSLRVDTTNTGLGTINGLGTITTAGTSTIEIENVPGYTAAAAVAQNLDSAWKNITDTKDKLTDNPAISLTGTPYAQYTSSVIGVVDITVATASSTTPKQIATTNNGVVVTTPPSEATNIVIPTGTTITGSVTYEVLGSPPPFANANLFTLGVSAVPDLTLTDGGYTGSTNTYGVVSVKEYFVTDSLLTSPKITNVFHIGVKSNR
jgi:hypothetical protein